MRLATLRAAGEMHVPMTTGLLIGIGETRRERIESLLALRSIQDEHGHLQEIIIQNFPGEARHQDGRRRRARPAGTALDDCGGAFAVRTDDVDLRLRSTCNPEGLHSLVRAGINDWGGVSPVTPDHVNPEAPWPHLADLARATDAAGRNLVERLALAPAYAVRPEIWTDPAITPRIRRLADSRGFARPDAWYAGSGAPLPPSASRDASKRPRGTSRTRSIIAAARAGHGAHRSGHRSALQRRGPRPG